MKTAIKTRSPTELEQMIVLADDERHSLLQVLQVLQVLARTSIAVPSGTAVTDNFRRLVLVLFDVDAGRFHARRLGRRRGWRSSALIYAPANELLMVERSARSSG